MIHRDQLVAVVKRQRLEQDAADHAENGGVRAYPDRQRRHRNNGEERHLLRRRTTWRIRG